MLILKEKLIDMWDNRYRLLKKGEIIHKDDEVGNIGYNEDGSMKWQEPKPETIGGQAPDRLFTSHRWYRRLKP